MDKNMTEVNPLKVIKLDHGNPSQCAKRISLRQVKDEMIGRRTAHKK